MVSLQLFAKSPQNTAPCLRRLVIWGNSAPSEYSTPTSNGLVELNSIRAFYTLQCLIMADISRCAMDSALRSRWWFERSQNWDGRIPKLESTC